MNLKETLLSMREIAENLDILGKQKRAEGIIYKAQELFEAANKLRVAAQLTEYALA